MKKILTAAVLVASLGFGSVNATCWSGCGGDSHDTDNSTHNTNTANGGQGGQGGQGGTGVGIGVGVGKGGSAHSNAGAIAGSNSRSGAAVLGSGNSTVRNTVRNTNDLSNRNLNAQGQMQGQVGIVKGGDVDASSRNSNFNGSHSSSFNGGNTLVIGGGYGEGQEGGGSTLSPTSTSSVGDVTNNVYFPEEGLNRDLSTTVLDSRDLSTSVDDSDVSVDASDNSVYIEEAQKRNPVSTAYAAPLVTSNDTCMGSTSAGGQGITLGLSFATTWKDEDCIIRKDARFLHNAQHQTVALGLMCEKASVRRAVARAGSVAERLACGLNEDGSDPDAK